MQIFVAGVAGIALGGRVLGQVHRAEGLLVVWLAVVSSGNAEARTDDHIMKPGVQRQMESGFGPSFGEVRIHRDATADKLTRSVQAKAFTTGKDIFFQRGEYNPGSSADNDLLAHELTHTVQQGAVWVSGC